MLFFGVMGVTLTFILRELTKAGSMPPDNQVQQWIWKLIPQRGICRGGLLLDRPRSGKLVVAAAEGSSHLSRHFCACAEMLRPLKNGNPPLGLWYLQTSSVRPGSQMQIRFGSKRIYQLAGYPKKPKQNPDSRMKSLSQGINVEIII